MDGVWVKDHQIIRRFSSIEEAIDSFCHQKTNSSYTYIDVRDIAAYYEQLPANHDIVNMVRYYLHNVALVNIKKDNNRLRIRRDRPTLMGFPIVMPDNTISVGCSWLDFNIDRTLVFPDLENNIPWQIWYNDQIQTVTIKTYYNRI